ncbi:YbcC family protein [Thiomonas bhubaneswarensis]|uniref:Probable inorganic carbon transporter subunit DabA n=1 Tax=Thiomonas bhubaneswarensis TaxID=339866 RepID=A0A0K6HSG1_9BURK|nr:DUF2309 domain-containing protein [Thiomonas bhubaneswarensis]CUA93977.1 Uncharacterized conserved protein YbcC, UPF0753/DUF2309 family [Thiomonas bhubaneswarensis]
MNLNDASQAITSAAQLDARIDAACARIAPLWPLKHFVAVNPYFGLRDLRFQDASDLLARVVGSSLYMPWDYWREQIDSGRLTPDDIDEALTRLGSALEVQDVLQTLSTRAPKPRLGMAPVSVILERVEGGLWSSFVTERISLNCAAYFDLGQAMVAMPWRGQGLYASWKAAAMIDRSPAMMGLGDFRAAVARLPERPREAIAWALAQLEIPDAAVERYLHAALLSINGWASWTRYLSWQAELQGEQNDSVVDLLAIRLMWDVLLYQEKRSSALVARWHEMLAESMRAPSAKRQAAAEIDRVLLLAMEVGVQRPITHGLKRAVAAQTPRPAVQAAFCIDVRSEVFRRSLETVAPKAQTLGFAGFFGMFIEVLPLGADQGRTHVPVIFNPSYCIPEQIEGGSAPHLAQQRRQRLGLAKAWKGFKLSAASCFSFVEAAGLMYAPKLLANSLGWSRPVPDPASQGLDAGTFARLRPVISSAAAASCGHAHPTRVLPVGIPEADRVDNAERILRSMALTEQFARLVLLVGHGSTTVNNPHATSLDCGACAGQTGEASARVVAALLNQPAVREGLRARGIIIPQDTWFLPALHDTTTDAMRVFDTDDLPVEFNDDLAQTRQWLEQAGDLARMERAALLGLAHLPDHKVHVEVQKRSRDWAQVRPEWALANNAAFIAAPRQRTAAIDLQGRAFLHDYVWQNDEGFKILELIMTAPMVVANWINLQYYGSVIDAARLGSGNKVLHNIVGGAIGVLEGNGGDLRVGLPLQSVHDGQRWMHEPVRLSVFLEAPQQAIDAVIARHQLVRELVDGGWLHILQIDASGDTHRRKADGQWA